MHITNATTPAPPNDATIEWLLDGDPAIRWQTLRDLVGASTHAIEHERRNVALTGWGGRLLALQDAAGAWASAHSSDGGLYNPKWTSTTYTMLLLRDFGLAQDNAQARNACALLLDGGLRNDGGIRYGKAHAHSETCITGMVLSILSYFKYNDDRLSRIAEYLLKEQMADGGWNCRRQRGATHASMHTTISVLEGLRFLELQRVTGVRELRATQLRAAQLRAQEFLLAHRLFRSHRTGLIIKSEFTRLVFPPRWHYDILRALDYFRSVDAPRDPRLAEAVDIIRTEREDNGRWPLKYAYSGKTHFTLERIGAPSRWNTLRALRVLKWWSSAPSAVRKKSVKA